MDHGLYAYSALPLRPASTPALGGVLSAFSVLFLEHWELRAPADALRDPRMVGEFGSFTPDYRSWSQRECGLRVGIFRVIDALKDAGIRPVIAANAMAVQRLPHLVELFQQWGCDWIAHGQSATRMMHARMPVAEQAQHIQSAVDRLVRHTGQQPLGWLSQDWGCTPDTPELLARAGIQFTLDWCNDDQPYWMHTTPPLLAIPLASEWGDVQSQWLRNIEPRAHATLTLQAFTRLRAECAAHTRGAVFGPALPPWLCGMPSRIAALRGLLKDLRAHDDAHRTTPYSFHAAWTANNTNETN
jgi:allantoinase